jgi:uncharacterized membrane protein YfcA
MTWLLTLASLATATLSAILGMGGGILLLAVMFCFMPFGEAIPLHAAVQLVSNGTRILAYRRAADWDTIRRFLMGVVPGVMIAGLLLWSLGEVGQAEPYVKIVIGVYILTATFLPKPKPTPGQDGTRGFTLLGLVSGTAGLTVGATGPLIAPLFARRHFVKERLIATKAACQMLTHVFKIIAFWMLGTIDFARFSPLLVAMAAAAVLGTFLGRRFLKHVSPAAFVALYRIALGGAGLKVLIIDGIVKVLATGSAS